MFAILQRPRQGFFTWATSPRLTKVHTYGQLYRRDFQSFIDWLWLMMQMPVTSSRPPSWCKYTCIATWACSLKTWKICAWSQQFPQRTRDRLGRRVWQEGGDLWKSKPVYSSSGRSLPFQHCDIYQRKPGLSSLELESFKKWQSLFASWEDQCEIFIRLFLIIWKTNKPFLAIRVSPEMSDVHVITELM